MRAECTYSPAPAPSSSCSGDQKVWVPRRRPWAPVLCRLPLSSRGPKPAALSSAGPWTAGRWGTSPRRPRRTLRLCRSMVIGGPAPPPKGAATEALPPPVGSPWVSRSKAEAVPTESCPTRGLRTARLVPVSNGPGAVMSLTSQGDSFPGGVPDLNGKYYILFRCPITHSFDSSYFNLFQNFSLLSLLWTRKTAVRLRLEP